MGFINIHDIKYHLRLGFPKMIFFSCYLVNFPKNYHNLMPDKLFFLSIPLLMVYNDHFKKNVYNLKDCLSLIL